MIVNDLARHSGIAPHVVRYYSRIGLLQPTRHPENGYKLFDRSDLHRLRFIRQAKSLGFTLNEIKQLLQETSHGNLVCPTARRILEQRIEETRREIVRLTRLHENMECALRKWEDIPDGAPTGRTPCPLIASVAMTSQA